MATFTYVGTPDDDTAVVIVYGMTFERGEPVDVPNNHPQIGKFRGNPTFAETKAEVTAAQEADAIAERQMLVEELAKRGITHRANASDSTLQKLYDDALLAEAKA